MSVRANLEKASSELAKVIGIISKLSDATLVGMIGDEEAWEIRCQMSALLADLEDEV
jgi:hypothetical protein